MLGRAEWVQEGSVLRCRRVSVCWSRGRSGCWSGLWRGRRIDAGAHEEKQIDEQDRDEHETADEDVGAESEHGFMFGKVRRWDVFVLVVAFVMMFWHADKLTSRMQLHAGAEKKNFSPLFRGGSGNPFPKSRRLGTRRLVLRPDLDLFYSSRPGRDMSSRIASLGLLLW
jgi:hypothetical protein